MKRKQNRDLIQSFFFSFFYFYLDFDANDSQGKQRKWGDHPHYSQSPSYIRKHSHIYLQLSIWDVCLVIFNRSACRKQISNENKYVTPKNPNIRAPDLRDTLSSDIRIVNQIITMI